MSGVVGIYSKERNNVSNIIYYGLYALQHRGQVSTGIAVNNNGFVDYFKDLGLVHEVFPKETMERLRGNIGIGHIRYATTGDTTTVNAQPLVVGYRKGALALAHDGAVVNFEKLRDGLEDQGAIFQSELDTEVIANLIARYHKDNIEDAIIKALDDINGTYGLVIMTTDKLIGARDQYGVKSLSIGKLGEDYILASETCAFDTIGAEFIRDVEPGEIVVIDENGLESIRRKSYDKKLCLFEIIYFARPDSKLDNKSIYLSRIEAGKQLVVESPVDGDIVIGAPDSGTIPAIGYAEGSKIPYAEGLIKNRYVGRTFIQPTQELREQGVRIKLNVLKENVEGKRVILVDDSIVRGTTIKRTIEMIKNAGAKEIHVRISSPPVLHPCYLGMDTPTRENLIAAQMSKEEIRKLIGADSLEYLSLEGLLKAAGGCEFCTGCLDGNYPIHKE
ncbi:amidophosphoribosyltransferase [Tissierella pigra]|uniref:Amidophosphoribosyltransferase n=1 Tax=Tissierella pigra TaxID=2607614 RepID=A0A6N7XUV3_9FIRM|nr:amidophosphoribosyltransferase [Tissierella pigra]MBU5427565.1 amidophosphoribosyltransferase [Tissierella pigra]MSU00314.1 amidophosphoribosyltransferase [Tissierella pigra]